MENWCSLSKKDLLLELFVQEQELNDNSLKIWNKIKIMPEIWSCNDVINSNFWAIALLENEVIWYNDITETFVKSPYKTKGEILIYKANKNKLSDFLTKI